MMMKSNSRNNTPNQSTLPPFWAVFVMLTGGLIGVADAGYLTVKYYQQSEVTCSILNGCSQVLSSEYATILGTPTALYGLLFYLTVVAGVLWYVYTKDVIVIYKLSILAVIAFLVSLGFVYLQAFVLEAWCFYCLISAGLSFVLAVVGLYILLNAEDTLQLRSEYKSR